MSQFAAVFDKVPTWILIVSILGITLLGFFDVLRKVREGNRKLTFSEEFRSSFLDYVNSRGEDRGSYHKMMLQSNRMQAEMGPFGIWHHFRDPPLEYKNYGIIVNGLPKIRRYFEKDDFLRNSGEIVQMFDDALVRFLGVLEDDLNESKKKPSQSAYVFPLRSGTNSAAAPPFLCSFRSDWQKDNCINPRRLGLQVSDSSPGSFGAHCERDRPSCGRT